MTIKYNFVNMYVQHTHRRSDSLIYYFVTSKGNKMGYRANDTWHVYLNPKNPNLQEGGMEGGITERLGGGSPH